MGRNGENEKRQLMTQRIPSHSQPSLILDTFTTCLVGCGEQCAISKPRRISTRPTQPVSPSY